MKPIVNGVLAILLLLAIGATLSLSIKEIQFGPICPKILGIPACYIVFSLFTLAAISLLMGALTYRLIFFTCIAIIFLIASYGTLGELIGFANCPKTSGGTPMCFISLAICSALLVLKTISEKLTSTGPN